jgi:MYXO-CTERM domain-containing protein
VTRLPSDATPGERKRDGTPDAASRGCRPSVTVVHAARSAWSRRAVIALLAASFTAGAVGNALTPMLLRESPATLLTVHASYPQMGLASARLDPVTFVAVAAVRRWLGELVFFAGGRVLGGELLAWYAQRRGKSLALPHRLNHRYAVVRDAVVVLLPHPLVAAFFGAVGMPGLRYTALKLVGSVVTVLVLWRVAGVVRLPLSVAADFVEANAVAITALGLLGAGALWWWRRRTKRGGAADPAP